MKRFIAAIKNFFLPPATATTARRILPLFSVALIVFVLILAVTIGWETTNSVSFCGLTCHTMPPEYETHQASVHANVTCEDCHMGRDVLGVLIPRKISYSWQTGTAMLTNSYEYPIVAKNMRPALDACENCHEPETFTSDKLVEIKHYKPDENNSATSTYLVVKTGGGTQRQGLGFGIHWHIENPVYFYSTDRERQQIPYVVVTNPDGTKTEYVDVESGVDPSTISPEDLQKMDCITCHNRVAHGIASPDVAVDNLLTRGLISPEIPNIKKLAVRKLSGEYASEKEAMDSIAALKDYYQANYPDYAKTNPEQIEETIQVLQSFYKTSNFPDQEVDWKTHPDNAGHITSPGCFRCHDGKHLTQAGDSVRLECNLCHSIPVVAEPNQVSASLQLNRGFEPETHKNSNWINLHRTVFDQTCQGCHTIEDPGGTSNTSFCSNSACHGASYKFAGFDAPGLFEVLAAQAAAMATPTPSVTAEPTKKPAAGATPSPTASGPLTWEQVAPLFTTRCSACHSANAMGGLNLTSYATAMQGGTNGPVIVPGDPEASLLIQVQTGATKHFGQFTADELEIIQQWIKEGALEK